MHMTSLARRKPPKTKYNIFRGHIKHVKVNYEGFDILKSYKINNKGRNAIKSFYLIQHPVQFIPCLNHSVSIVAINHKNKTLSVLEVMPPQWANLQMEIA
jgi:hypothetical protein